MDDAEHEGPEGPVWPTVRPLNYWLTAGLCWLVLLASAALIVALLPTAVMMPSSVEWQRRLAITGLEGEFGYRYVLWPVGLLAASLVLGRRHRGVGMAASLLALAALALLAKPVVQAWQLGQSLPAQMDAAFGPGAVDRPPFSLRGLYAPLPAPLKYEESLYDGTHPFEFIRAVGRSPAPCVILLHGGGWFGAGYQDHRPFPLWLAHQGYAVAAIAYSVLPRGRWPEPRDDTLHAIETLRAHARELGIDPDRFVLIGHSAGAQIALATAYAAHDPAIRGVIAFYPPTDLRDGWRLASIISLKLHGMDGRRILQTFFGGTPQTAGTNYDSASAVTLVGPDTPPTLLVHGVLDSLVPIGQSQELDAKLGDQNRPHLLVAVPWASHSFDLMNFDGPGGQIAAYAVARFLAAETR